jgi:nuclease A inhibitor-like protein
VTDRSRSRTHRSPRRRSKAGAASSLAGLQAELDNAAAGLVHSSESDYPFRFFALPAGSETKLTVEAFLSVIGLSQQLLEEIKLPAGQLIEERTLDRFFPTLDVLAGHHGADRHDPQVVSEWKRFQNLKTVLRKQLRRVKVFRIGRVEVRCYIAGLAQDGNIAGLVTTAIET